VDSGAVMTRSIRSIGRYGYVHGRDSRGRINGGRKLSPGGHQVSTLLCRRINAGTEEAVLPAAWHGAP